LTDFRKIVVYQIFMKILQVGVESFDAAGRTITMLTVTCRNFTNAHEMEYCLINSLLTNTLFLQILFRRIRRLSRK